MAKNDWGFGPARGSMPLSISDFNVVKIRSLNVVAFAPATDKAKKWIRTNQAYLGIRTKYLNRGFAVKSPHVHKIARKLKCDGLTVFFSGD
jgi:hypothetical protein